MNVADILFSECDNVSSKRKLASNLISVTPQTIKKKKKTNRIVIGTNPNQNNENSNTTKQYSNNNELKVNTEFRFGDPAFMNSLYSIYPVTPDNTLMLDITELGNIYEYPGLVKQKREEIRNDIFLVLDERYNFFLCNIHRLTFSDDNSTDENVDKTYQKDELCTPIAQKPMNCNQCIPFKNYPFSFLLRTRYHYFQIPPISIFTNKIKNYFVTFVNKALDNIKLKTNQIENGKLPELKYYNRFMSDCFIVGHLKILKSGKKSLVRNKIIGFLTSGLSLTVTIDSTLPPDIVAIPHSIYDELDLISCLAICNRHPSISENGIYPVRIIPHYDNHQNMKCNAFIIKGSNTDQDGDQHHFALLENHYKGNRPSHQAYVAVLEIKSATWKYGYRRNVLYRPTYMFSGFHRLLLYRYDKVFHKFSPLWRKLNYIPLKERPDYIMNLGCSIMYEEVDEFIYLLNFVIRNYFEVKTNWMDIFTEGNDSILYDIYASGSKGSSQHLEQVRTYLKAQKVNYKTIFEQFVTNFNNFVGGSKHMSHEGTNQFSFLYTQQGILLFDDDIYYNSKVIVKNYSHFGASSYYNPYSIDFTLNCIHDSISSVEIQTVK